MNPAYFTTQTLKYKIGEIAFEPTYLQAGLIVFLIFLLILTLARLRRMYVHWSFKGFLPSIFFGFLLALIFEGFLLISGRTLFTELVGWENAPKPIATALEVGRSKLVNVLGTQTSEIPSSYASEEVAVGSVFSNFEALSVENQEEFRNLVCTSN